MSQALRSLRRLASKPPAKARPTPAPAPPVTDWRNEISRWSESERYAFEERVAIKVEDAGLSLGQAEREAYEEVRGTRAALSQAAEEYALAPLVEAARGLVDVDRVEVRLATGETFTWTPAGS